METAQSEILNWIIHGSVSYTNQRVGGLFSNPYSQYDDVSLGNILMAQPMVCLSP